MPQNSKTELKIERVEPGPDGEPGGVRFTAIVPWSEMNTQTMDKMVKRRVIVPADDDTSEDEFLYVNGEGPVDEDSLLIVGAVPALLTAAARQRPTSVYAVLNWYAYEMDKQRSLLAGRRPRDNYESLWVSAQQKAVSVLMRELRFVVLEDDDLTRAELLDEERMLGGAAIDGRQTS